MFKFISITSLVLICSTISSCIFPVPILINLSCQWTTDKPSVDKNILLNAPKELKIDNLRFINETIQDSSYFKPLNLENVKFTLSGRLNVEDLTFSGCYKGYVAINFYYTAPPKDEAERLSRQKDFSDYKLNGIWIQCQDKFWEIDLKKTNISNEYYDDHFKYEFSPGPKIERIKENTYTCGDSLIVRFTKDKKYYFLKSDLVIDFGQFKARPA